MSTGLEGARLAQTLCFCTLALGRRYRLFARRLSESMQLHVPGLPLLVLSDGPADFADLANVIARKHVQRGMLSCYHDKRFVLLEALSRYDAAVMVDADVLVTAPPSFPPDWRPGLTGKSRPLIAHALKSAAGSIPLIRQVARKWAVRPAECRFVSEPVFVLTRDSGREGEFLRVWGGLARDFELRGFATGEGISMGLAAAKVGLPVHPWPGGVRDKIVNLKASSEPVRWRRVLKKAVRACRLFVARILAERGRSSASIAPVLIGEEK
jgi:hypothetical protein